MSSDFFLARVTDIHPEDHSVDLLVYATGARIPGVQVLTSDAGSRSGTLDLPDVDIPHAGKWTTGKTAADAEVIGAYIGGRPFVLGFLPPQINQISPRRKRERIFRHASDVSVTISPEGDIDLRHPGGLTLRIGESPQTPDMAGADADGLWREDRNTGRKPFVRLRMAEGRAVLTISPSGAVSLETQSTLDARAQGAVSVHTEATAHVQSAGTTTVRAPRIEMMTPTVYCSGDVLVDGDVVASGVSLVNHTHGGVRRDNSNTDPPN